MTHPIELFTSKVIYSLRGADLPETAENDTPIVKGFYFSWDSDQADITLSLSRDSDDLLHVDATVSGEPRWFTLNLAMGPGGFSGGATLGLIAELSKTKGIAFPMFVRSLRDEQTEDTFLRESLIQSDDRSVATVFNTLSDQDFMTGSPGHHTLVLRLPPQSFSLTLHDLRVILVPAWRKLQIEPID